MLVSSVKSWKGDNVSRYSSSLDWACIFLICVSFPLCTHPPPLLTLHKTYWSDLAWAEPQLHPFLFFFSPPVISFLSLKKATNNKPKNLQPPTCICWTWPLFDMTSFFRLRTFCRQNSKFVSSQVAFAQQCVMTKGMLSYWSITQIPFSSPPQLWKPILRSHNDQP